MPVFSAWRLEPLPDRPLVRRRGFRWSPAVASHANWQQFNTPAPVTVWLTPDGRAGEGSPPPGARVLMGGHLEPVNEDEAAALIAAGWGDFLTEVA